MTLPTHALLGLIIGKITGNYVLGVASSVLIDIDHISSYIKHGVFFKAKRLWKAITDQKDPYGDQRGILHNVLFFAVGSCALIVISKTVGIIITIGWFGHLCLDALDNSDYYPLYPDKKLNLRGPIKYNTWQELLFFILLLGVFFLL